MIGRVVSILVLAADLRASRTWDDTSHISSQWARHGPVDFGSMLSVGLYRLWALV